MSDSTAVWLWRVHLCQQTHVFPGVLLGTETKFLIPMICANLAWCVLFPVFSPAICWCCSQVCIMQAKSTTVGMRHSFPGSLNSQEHFQAKDFTVYNVAMIARRKHDCKTNTAIINNCISHYTIQFCPFLLAYF